MATLNKDKKRKYIGSKLMVAEAAASSAGIVALLDHRKREMHRNKIERFRVKILRSERQRFLG